MPGTYRKRGKDSYLLEVCIGTDYKGNPNRYHQTVHCKSDKEADKELAKFYTACAEGNYSKASNYTVSQFCTMYNEEVAPLRMKQGPLAEHKRIIKKEVDPGIGTHKITKLTAIHVQKWVNELSKRVSAKTVKNYFSALDSSLECAVKWQIIKDNPCKYVDLPKIERKETDWLRKAELEKLLSLLISDPNDQLMYRTGILLLLFSGMRKGELAGLKWDDVNWDENTITIARERIYRSAIGTYEDSPKSERSKRTEVIPEEIMHMLKRTQNEQKLQQMRLGSKWENSGFIIVNDFGAAAYPNNIYKFFKAFQLRNDLRYVSLHKLRHTHASMLAYMKVDLSQISKRLGHAQTSTTSNIYVHLFEETDKEIAKQLSNSFLKKVQK